MMLLTKMMMIITVMIYITIVMLIMAVQTMIDLLVNGYVRCIYTKDIIKNLFIMTTYNGIIYVMLQLHSII